MTFRSSRLGWALAAGLLVAACQERLTAPGECPATCPGGTPVVRDTVLDAEFDTTYVGYLIPGATGAGFLVSNGMIGGVTDYGVVRFLPRADSILAADTFRTYTIDSVALEFTLLARDTLASGLRLEFHRLPAATDSGVAYGDVVTPVNDNATLVDSATVPDSARRGYVVRFVFSDSAALARVALAPGDSGVLALGVALVGGPASGVRINGTSGGANPKFITYVTADVADTTAQAQVITRGPAFSPYVSSSPAIPDQAVLTVGGGAVARAFIRFPWPAYLRDTALLARATLELTPADTIRGLPGDSAFVTVRGIQADFGPKSPASSIGGTKYLAIGSLDTLRIDVIAEVQAWQRNTLPDPPVLLASLTPEGASFTVPTFLSTRSGAGRPRLHVTYQIPFDFERP